MLPVEVLIHFSDGKEVWEKWDGVSRTMEYDYTRTGKVDWVKIDPDFKIGMDINYINNSKTVDPDRVPVRRIRNKTIVFLQFFMSLISL